MNSRALAILLMAGLISISNFAQASTECTTYVNNNWSGAGGEILILFEAAPPVYVEAGPSQKNALATVLTALTSEKKVSIRYAADGVPCVQGSSRNDFAGIWINR